MSVWGWFFGFFLFGVIFLIFYDIFFRLWKFVREGINDLER